MVDRRIYVVGFSLYGSIHGPCEYQVTIQIIHTGSERLLGKGPSINDATHLMRKGNLSKDDITTYLSLFSTMGDMGVKNVKNMSVPLSIFENTLGT